MFTSKKAGITNGFVSEIDQFLQMLNVLPGTKSNSKLEEEQKYKRIFAQRDVVQTEQSKELSWKDF